MPDGSIWTAGDNYKGEIGDGVVTTQPTLTRFNVLSGAAAVAVGGNHTVALVGGAAQAWGHGTLGELCDGLAQTHRTPTTVPGITGAVQVAAASSSSFFLLNDGTVRSCGSNADGILGDGTTTLRTTPVAVVGLSDAIAIEGGLQHALALRANGTVVAWGSNSFGRLGDGTTTARHTPVPVPGLSNVVAVAAGQAFSMALDATGHVWVWGPGFYGTNGDNTTTDHLTPYQVPGLANVVAIAAGSFHAVALDSSHHVWTWGANTNGAIGDGIATGTIRPVPTLIAGLTPIGAIVAGSQNTFAFAQDGGLYGWGDNSTGQLGDGTTINRYSPTVLAEAGGIWRTATPRFSVSPSPPTYTADLTTLITSATTDATVRYTLGGADPIDTDPIVPTGGLLIDQNRTVKARAWKAGEAPSNVATATYTLQPALPVISPAGGAYTSPRTVTITTTTAGAVMRYTTDGTDPTPSSPAYGGALPIATGTTLKAKAFKSGWTDSVTRTATYTFNYGTLDAPVISPGGGTYSTDQTVSLTAPSAPGGAVLRYTLNGADPNASSALYSGPITVASGLTLKARAFHVDWTQSAVASATYAFTAATPTFTVATGTYPAGQVVALATSTPNATIRYTMTGAAPTANDPVLLPGSTLTLGDYTLTASAWKTGYTTSATASATYQVTGNVTEPRIDAGDTHTLVVKRDGTVWAFGSNGWGYLGDNTTTARSLPVRAAGVTGIKGVAAGAQHSLAVGLDGRVYSWGTNTSGQQGDGATIGYRTVPWPVPAVTNAAAVAAGSNHSLALTTTGQVYAWGANGSGQLGLGHTTVQPTPTLIPGLSDIAGIAAGDTHSLAWTTAGVLYAWGNNGNGRLGDSSTTQRTSPVVITGITGVAEAAAGSGHSIARTTSGEVWTWGRGFDGALGLGNTTDRWMPTQLTGLLNVLAIGAGSNHSLASAAMTTYAWGKNNSSQVGDGLTANRTSPYATSVGPAVQLTGGSVHSVALDANGAVWTWGGNSSSQLGNGTATPATTPAPISGDNQTWGASTPTASPGGGTFNTDQSVTLASRTPGATVRYTVNGSDPTTADAIATGPIAITQTTTLKARAWKAGLDPSGVLTAVYTLRLDPPVATPTPGAYPTPTDVTLVASPDATIRYTTDGSLPTESSPVYMEAFHVTSSLGLTARAFRSGWTPSSVLSAWYLVQSPTAITTYVVPAANAAGWNNTPVTVHFACGSGIPTGNCPASVSIDVETQQEVTRTAVDINGNTVSVSATVRTDWTPPVLTVLSPGDDTQTTSDSVAVSATVSDSGSGAGSAGCNLGTSPLSGESLSCVAALGKGRNVVLVHAKDVAGNSASVGVSIARTGTPSELAGSPSEIAMVVGERRAVRVIDDFGAAPEAVLWTVGDQTVVELSTDGGAELVGLAAGTTAVTARVGGLSTQISVVVLPSAGIPSGTRRWVLPQLTSGWNHSVIVPHRVAEDSPAFFLWDYSDDELVLRRFRAEGTELSRQPVPSLNHNRVRSTDLNAFGDVFGGVIFSEHDDDGSSYLVRAGGGSAPDWVYATQYDLESKPAQSHDGTIAHVEWNWTVNTVDRPSGDLGRYDGWLVRLDGRSGQLLSRTPLPTFTRCLSISTRCTERPGITNPIVGLDGSVYLIVHTGTTHERWEDNRLVPVSGNYDVQLMQVQPDGQVSFRPLLDVAVPYSGSYPDSLLVAPDGRLVAGAADNNSIWLIGPGSVVQHPTPFMGRLSIITDDNVALFDGASSGAIDLATLAVLWSSGAATIKAPGPERGSAVAEVTPTAGYAVQSILIHATGVTTPIPGLPGGSMTPFALGDWLVRETGSTGGVTLTSTTIDSPQAFFAQSTGHAQGHQAPPDCRDFSRRFWNVDAPVVFDLQQFQPWWRYHQGFTAAVADWDQLLKGHDPNLGMRVATSTAPPMENERLVVVLATIGPQLPAPPEQPDYAAVFRDSQHNLWSIEFYSSEIDKALAAAGDVAKGEHLLRSLYRHEIGHIVGFADRKFSDGREVLMGYTSAANDTWGFLRTDRISCSERTGVYEWYELRLP
jgi:alpha-tubulin suppressor-like RCC1 family protein